MEWKVDKLNITDNKSKTQVSVVLYMIDGVSKQTVKGEVIMAEENSNHPQLKEKLLTSLVSTIQSMMPDMEVAEVSKVSLQDGFLEELRRRLGI